MAAGPQPGPRTGNRRETSLRVSQPTSGGSWSRLQLPHRRARGGGGEALRGGRGARRGGGEREGAKEEAGGRRLARGGRGQRAQPAVTRRFFRGRRRRRRSRLPPSPPHPSTSPSRLPT